MQAAKEEEDEEAKAKAEEEAKKAEEEAKAKAEAEAKAEAAAQEAKAAEERRERAAAAKAAREASEMRRHRLALQSAKLNLAEMHAARSVVFRCGFQPWLRLVLLRREGKARADEHRYTSLCSPPFHGWAMLARHARARRLGGATISALLAQRLRCRVLLRRGVEGMLSYNERTRRGVLAAKRRLGLGLLRRLFNGWGIQARLSLDLREAERLKLEMAAADRHDRHQLRQALGEWRDFAESERFERRREACKEELWRKVAGWLDEGGDSSYSYASASGSGGGGGFPPAPPGPPSLAWQSAAGGDPLV